MSFKAKAEALRLSESVLPEDRQAYAALCGAIGKLEADSAALDDLVNALAPRLEVDLRGLKTRDAAKAIIDSLSIEAAKAAEPKRTPKAKRPGEE